MRVSGIVVTNGRKMVDLVNEVPKSADFACGGIGKKKFAVYSVKDSLNYTISPHG